MGYGAFLQLLRVNGGIPLLQSCSEHSRIFASFIIFTVRILRAITKCSRLLDRPCAVFAPWFIHRSLVLLCRVYGVGTQRNAGFQSVSSTPSASTCVPLGPVNSGCSAGARCKRSRSRCLRRHSQSSSSVSSFCTEIGDTKTALDGAYALS